MTVDPFTMLILTMGIAFITACFLAVECRALKDASLGWWSAGFASIALGCSLSPLRESYSVLIGLWFANGLLIAAHLCFLHGAGAFVGRRIDPLWWSVFLPWTAMLVVPDTQIRMDALAAFNAAAVAILALKTAMLFFSLHGNKSERVAHSLGVVFLIHGFWYVGKIGLVFTAGAYTDLTRFQGFAIGVSLLEGVMVAVLLGLLMAASVRRRQEQEIKRLAERDSLTGILNRRAFEKQAHAAITEAAAQQRASTLMLLDFDHFKAINDNHGHGFGDRMLTKFTGLTESLLPPNAIFGRLGGDEFAMLIPGIQEEEARHLGTTLCIRFAELTGTSGEIPGGASVSIGAVTFCGDSDLTGLLAAADARLYEAKRRGRGQIRMGTMGAVSPLHGDDWEQPMLRAAAG